MRRSPASARAAGRPHFTPPGAAGAESPARSARASAAARRWEREPAGHGSRRVLLQTLLRAVDRVAAEVSARLGVPTGERNVRAGRTGRRCVLRPGARPSLGTAGGGGRGRSAVVRALHRSRLAEPPRFPPSKPALREGCGERSRGAGAVGQGPLRAEGREGSAGRGGRARARAHPQRPFGQGRLNPGSGGALPGPAGSGGGGPGALCPATAQPIRRPGSGAAAERGGAATGAGSAAWGGRSGAARRSRARRVSSAAGAVVRGYAGVCGCVHAGVYACAARLRAVTPWARPRGSRCPGGSPLVGPETAPSGAAPSRPAVGHRAGQRSGTPEAAAAASGGPSRAVPAACSPIPARASVPSGYF